MTDSTAAFNAVNYTFTDQSPLFQYAPSRETTPDQGWISSYTKSDPAAYKQETFGTGTSAHTTTSSQSSVTLQFTGSAVYLSGSADTPSSYSITLDNKNVNVNPGAGYLFTQSSIPYGAHTLTLAVNSGTVAVTQAIITTGVGLPGANVKTSTTNFTGKSIASTPDTITFGDVKQWQAQLDFDGQTYPRISTNAPSASLTFSISSASAFAFYGSTNWNHDSYKVQLTGTDGTSLIQNLNGVTKYISLNQLLFLATGLDNKEQYNVTVQNTATKNSVFFDISAYTIYNGVGGKAPSSTTSKAVKSATSTSSSATQSPTADTVVPPNSHVSTGGLVGIAVGALAILALGIGILFFVKKRNRFKGEDDALKMNEGTWDPPTGGQHEITPFNSQNYMTNNSSFYQPSEYGGAPPVAAAATFGGYNPPHSRRPSTSTAFNRQSSLYGDNASDAYASDAMLVPPSVAPTSPGLSYGSAAPSSNVVPPQPTGASVASSSRSYPSDSKQRTFVTDTSMEHEELTHAVDAGPVLPPMYDPNWAGSRTQ